MPTPEQCEMTAQVTVWGFTLEEALAIKFIRCKEIVAAIRGKSLHKIGNAAAVLFSELPATRCIRVDDVANETTVTFDNDNPNGFRVARAKGTWTEPYYHAICRAWLIYKWPSESINGD
jgi:hypothetical protein